MSNSFLARVGAIAVIGTACAVPAAMAETIVGLTTTNALTTFDSATPGNAAAPVTISGLALNERILGIDLRPRTGQLYGLSDASRLYTLNATTGAATFVAALAADPADLSAPFAALLGRSIGFDFNPVPDSNPANPASLRVMSDSGQNLRINVNALSAGLTTTDGSINGATTGLDAVAYINNDTDAATGTALFGIDSATDTLYSLVANAGTTTAIGSGLGFNAIGVAGMDVSGTTGTTYSSMTDGATGKSGLFTINLATGSATWVGELGIGGNTAIAPPLLDLSVAAIPEPESYLMLLAGMLGVAWVSRRRRNLRG